MIVMVLRQLVSGEGVYILAGSDNLGGGFQQNMEYFGNNKPEGEALAASSLTAPEEVQFVAGENKTIELVAEGGNMGIYVESIAIIGGSGFTLNEAFTEYQFISPGSTKSLSVSLDAQQASAQAVLVVTYNGGLQKNIVLTTGGSIVGLFNPGDQYNQEGEQVPVAPDNDHSWNQRIVQRDESATRSQSECFNGAHFGHSDL